MNVKDDAKDEDKIVKKETEIPKSARELVAESQIYIEENKSFVTKDITNNEDYQRANEILKNLKFHTKMLDTERRKVTKPLDDAKAIIMNWFQPYLETLAKTEKIIKNDINKYAESIERKRKEEIELNSRKAKAEEEKRKKELDEKKKKEDLKKAELEVRKKEEDRKIILIEENAKIEEANGNETRANELKKDAETIRKKEEELKLAIEYQEIKIESLDIEKDHIMIQPDEPKTPALPKIAGVIRRKKWNYRVNNIDLVPDSYIIIEKNINDKMLRSIINQASGQIIIPGIDIYEEKIIAAKAQ